MKKYLLIFIATLSCILIQSTTNISCKTKQVPQILLASGPIPLKQFKKIAEAHTRSWSHKQKTFNGNLLTVPVPKDYYQAYDLYIMQNKNISGASNSVIPNRKVMRYYLFCLFGGLPTEFMAMTLPEKIQRAVGDHPNQHLPKYQRDFLFHKDQIEAGYKPFQKKRWSNFALLGTTGITLLGVYKFLKYKLLQAEQALILAYRDKNKPEIIKLEKKLNWLHPLQAGLMSAGVGSVIGTLLNLSTIDSLNALSLSFYKKEYKTVMERE